MASAGEFCYTPRGCHSDLRCGSRNVRASTSSSSSAAAAARLLVVLLCAAGVRRCGAFVWPIDNVYPAGEYKFTFSELYMYSTQDAPLGVVQFEPSIEIDLQVEAAMVATRNATVRAAVFHVPAEAVVDPVNTAALNVLLRDLATASDLCTGLLPGMGADHMKQRKVALAPTAGGAAVTAAQAASDTQRLRNVLAEAAMDVAELTPVYVEQGHLRLRYKVRQSGLHSVIVQVCGPGDQWGGVSDATTTVKGTISFRNPYGYLSAIYYGYLPFEGGRAAVFGMFALLYLVTLVRSWEHVLPLHHAILLVTVVALGEATAWFGAYAAMNVHGMPYCCPFPAAVVLAMVLESVRRTLSRALLLCLCLGSGMARPDGLDRSEVVAVSVLSCLYLAASLMVDMRDVVEINDLHRTGTHAVWWDAPVLLFDVVFLVWIYAALLQTMAELREQGQTIKLQMYSSLATIMGVFVALVTGVTAVLVVARSGVFAWPWQLFWVQTVPWEVLNLAVMVGVSVIWQPSLRAKLLATSVQLATDDTVSYAANDDDDDGVELRDWDRSGQPWPSTREASTGSGLQGGHGEGRGDGEEGYEEHEWGEGGVAINPFRDDCDNDNGDDDDDDDDKSALPVIAG